MSKQRIALVTSIDLPYLFGGEQLLLPALETLGCQVSIEIWNNDAVNWADFDAVVIRCPWDYHEKLAAFLDWLDRLRVCGVNVINDLDTLAWNLDKKYLFSLAQQGHAVMAGLCLQADDQRSLSDLMLVLGSNELVIKPVQSAGAWRTLRVNAQNIEIVNQEFDAWRQEQEFLVQAFMPEIISEGEWSLIFIDGNFSHALLKRAKPGDFRVQSDHGGTVHAVDVPDSMRLQAQAILHSLLRMPCYARVDGVLRDGQFILMELELVEPELFLELHPQAPLRFAQAIQARLG
ncbi:ATP-grasp domain-containing protein [Undibacterium fentianense]|uniref:Prokaryotic glutathione synthetase ATP-binding domain-containing protein n=1 Tax=Undibacterium fentianense TaxID=2828728 RepID=A0A941E4U1_9BURK|nr:hypothetical protein [Undibacterium fentianense]MBR7800966.1 hypothetical protein [Undibacterium fentianense]